MKRTLTIEFSGHSKCSLVDWLRWKSDLGIHCQDDIGRHYTWRGSHAYINGTLIGYLHPFESRTNKPLTLVLQLEPLPRSLAQEIVAGVMKWEDSWAS
jgi:hypothetical protein